ncbi:unnamed protein product [Fraxinus pennsylvanica]|uniref:EDR1/CTR1/ARMC3-like peptidase-like domain-containing protein n=1 Tax=Fraxinus pennsylvanica TaxID=56036 RepID=A0AAD2A9Q1_9LAMI|nr:unnamed protein product [Fraxinus pennsylvanica]
MIGQIKHVSCRSRSILFKVLADTLGLDGRLMVVLPRGVTERADSFKQMSIVVLNSVELLVDLVHFLGKLIRSSAAALFLTRLYCRKKVIAEQRTASSSPEHYFFRGHGGSLLCGCRVSSGEDYNDLNASRVGLSTFFWISASLTSATGKNVSAGTYPMDACMRRRSCISMIPEIGDDTGPVER